MNSRLALAAALSVALAACGSDNQADETIEVTGETADVTAPVESEAETNAAADAETPAAEAPAEATPAPTPIPTPTPTPTRAAATPTPVAAAGPPASFQQCAICHSTEPGRHGLGPSLAGVFGAKAGHASGFAYSPAMLESNLTWNQATLNRYLTNPMGAVPGTTMAFAGVKDPAQRAEIIAFLRTL
jgi:cytochrome c